MELKSEMTLKSHTLLYCTSPFEKLDFMEEKATTATTSKSGVKSSKKKAEPGTANNKSLREVRKENSIKELERLKSSWKEHYSPPAAKTATRPTNTNLTSQTPRLNPGPSFGSFTPITPFVPTHFGTFGSQAAQSYAAALRFIWSLANKIWIALVCLFDRPQSGPFGVVRTLATAFGTASNDLHKR